MTQFQLVFRGNNADEGLIDAYDAGRAISGFERTIALTTHFLLHDEIITQATALRGARILSGPPEVGSWKLPLWVVATSSVVGSVGTLESSNPIGHLVYSFYDAIVYDALGVPVDYDKSLRELRNEAESAGLAGWAAPRQSQIEALIEKCEPGFIDMHRPIVNSRTALEGQIVAPERPLKFNVGPLLTTKTYKHLKFSEVDEDTSIISGKVSSYNINTFRGRIFDPEEQRLVPFEIPEECRMPSLIAQIAGSLRSNAIERNDDGEFIVKGGDIELEVYVSRTRNGRTRGYVVLGLSDR